MDRELLERAAAAAIAAGMPLVLDEVGPLIPGSGGGHRRWRPDLDDGDALRLAVRLGIDVIFPGGSYVECWHSAGGPVSEFGEEPDQCAATRRAIVRAAAAMKE